jgi:hypothetical protein
MVSFAIVVAGILGLAAIGAQLQENTRADNPRTVIAPDGPAVNWDRIAHLEHLSTVHIQRANDYIGGGSLDAAARQYDLSAADIETYIPLVRADYPDLARAVRSEATHLHGVADAMRARDYVELQRELNAAKADVRTVSRLTIRYRNQTIS